MERTLEEESRGLGLSPSSGINLLREHRQITLPSEHSRLPSIKWSRFLDISKDPFQLGPSLNLCVMWPGRMAIDEDNFSKTTSLSLNIEWGQAEITIAVCMIDSARKVICRLSGSLKLNPQDLNLGVNQSGRRIKLSWYKTKKAELYRPLWCHLRAQKKLPNVE